MSQHKQQQVSSDDDRKVRLSWRGDGEMLCVSYVTPEEADPASQLHQTRRIRVFDRQVCVSVMH